MPKPFYLTTSIAYVNAAPHLGFAMEAIEADAIARWMRQQGRKTFFLTGTDEHGVKIAKTASEQGIPVKDLCDQNSERFRELKEALNLSYDDFIRTSDQEKHWPGAEKLWKLMAKKGDIEKREYKALYCYGCEAFYTEKDLVDGKCPIHKTVPDLIAEENHFFKLSQYSEKIAELIDSNELEIIPEFRKNEILQMARGGFLDVSFSRPAEKLPWGVPVPDDPAQTMYVWCDALTNYISGIGFGQKDESKFEEFWNNGEVMHMIGKDILRFHAGVWIGMLLSAGIKTPNKIFVHGFLTSEGEKMSKSLGNVVDPFVEVKKYGADALRYFLLREVPVGRDADFSRKRFEENYQAHLANGLGNLASRVHTLCSRTETYSAPKNLLPDFAKLLDQADQNLMTAMKQLTLHEAISSIFEVVEVLDKKMDETKPWLLVKENPENAQELLANFLAALLWISTKLEPFLPITAEKMQLMFGAGKGKFGKGMMLFPRLEKLSMN